MIDPRQEAVLVAKKDGRFEDRTKGVDRCWEDEHYTYVTFSDGKQLPYKKGGRAFLVRAPISSGQHMRVEVRGEVWHDAQALRFDSPVGTWFHIFYPTKAGESWVVADAHDVRILTDATTGDQATDVMTYWRSVVAALPDSDPLHSVITALDFVHPDSALARYLSAAPIGGSGTARAALHPFSSNISQRSAAENALRYSVSVIEGPPGTGKTQTILNILASLVAAPGTSVGVVSFANAAVDNVQEKFAEEGLGIALARLGNSVDRKTFLAGQDDRNREVDQFLQQSPEHEPPLSAIVDLGSRLDRLQHDERRLAALRRELDAHRLERQHVERLLRRQGVPELNKVPSLRGSSDRIVDLLAETYVRRRRESWPLRWADSIRRYVRYGSLRGLDLDDTDTVLRLQATYYDRHILELETEVGQLERHLASTDLERLVAEHAALSGRVLRSSLRTRYAGRSRTRYDKDYPRRITDFLTEYPVILSTCHSLPRSTGQRVLLDYLIIDEASQINLPTAALALACCRNVVVVGDLRQLDPIVNETVPGRPASVPPAYDYQQHSILSSLIALYGDRLPRTMLREHYRCHPAIIGFCNDKFYDGQLIPMKPGAPDARPLVLMPTVEGNHSRRLLGGLVNDREIGVALREALPEQLAEFSQDDIGAETPYRAQADRMGRAFAEGWEGVEVDTINAYQGREKKAMVMSTVVDESWRGRRGIRFVDEPRRVNVGVSRAQERFVLITDNAGLPTSENFRDLVGYMLYQDPEHTLAPSRLISVFDLLYQRFSDRLRSLETQLGERSPYRSENIIWSVLDNLLEEPPYSGLAIQFQILLKSLLPHVDLLTEAQRKYVAHRASFDFVIVNRVTRAPLGAIEVDGFAFHEAKPAQQARDHLKDEICAQYGLPLLRLPTTGYDETTRLRRWLDDLLTAPPPTLVT